MAPRLAARTVIAPNRALGSIFCTGGSKSGPRIVARFSLLGRGPGSPPDPKGPTTAFWIRLTSGEKRRASGIVRSLVHGRSHTALTTHIAPESHHEYADQQCHL